MPEAMHQAELLAASEQQQEAKHNQQLGQRCEHSFLWLLEACNGAEDKQCDPAAIGQHDAWHRSSSTSLQCGS